MPGVLVVVFAAAQASRPPRELLEYVAQARKAGLTEQQIKQNAAQAGWVAEDVEGAIAASRPVPAPGAPAEPNPSPATPVPKPTSAASPPATSSRPVNAAAPAAPSPLPAASPEDYQIGEGDVLAISVYQEPTVSVQAAVVRPDGKISVPLIKDVSVAGLTTSQAEKLITEQLSDIIRAPNVTVVVSQINSKKIYLHGAVKKEGPIPYTYRMTVMQAISEAGGLSDYAKRKKIYILRTENGKQYKLLFDYDAVVKGEHFELNIPLTPGDEIIVPH